MYTLHHHHIIIGLPLLQLPLQPLSAYPDLGNAAMTVGGIGLKLLLGARSYVFYMGASYKNSVNTY